MAEPFPILTERIKKSGLNAKVVENDDKIVLKYGAVSSGIEYTPPELLLEFDARSTGEPADRYTITGDISDWTKELRSPIARPRVMRLERTFWEKATATHVYCLRGVFRGGSRYAKHWYDLDCLDHTKIAAKAISDRVLAADVAKHKQHFARKMQPAMSLPIRRQCPVTCFSYLRGELSTLWRMTMSKCLTLVCLGPSPLDLKPFCSGLPISKTVLVLILHNNPLTQKPYEQSFLNAGVIDNARPQGKDNGLVMRLLWEK